MKTANKQQKPINHAGECTRGPDVRHLGCGGAIWVSGEVRSLADFGMGFIGGKFVVKTKYTRKITGYSGECEKCRKSGAFMFKK